MKIKTMMMLVVFSVLISSLSFADTMKCPMCHKQTMCKMCKQMCDKHKTMDLEDKFFKKVRFILAYANEIDLKDDQKTQVMNEKFALKKNLIKTESEIKMISIDIKKQFMEDKLDLKVIYSLIDNKYDFKKEKVKTIVSAYNNLRNILNKDQYNKLKDIWSKNTNYQMRCMIESEHGKDLPSKTSK